MRLMDRKKSCSNCDTLKSKILEQIDAFETLASVNKTLSWTFLVGNLKELLSGDYSSRVEDEEEVSSPVESTEEIGLNCDLHDRTESKWNGVTKILEKPVQVELSRNDLSHDLKAQVIPDPSPPPVPELQSTDNEPESPPPNPPSPHTPSPPSPHLNEVITTKVIGGMNGVAIKLSPTSGVVPPLADESSSQEDGEPAAGQPFVQEVRPIDGESDRDPSQPLLTSSPPQPILEGESDKDVMTQGEVNGQQTKNSDNAIDNNLTLEKIRSAEESMSRVTAEDGRILFECLICSKRLTTSYNGLLHIRRVHHKDRYSCSTCDAKFYSHHNLKSHNCPLTPPVPSSPLSSSTVPLPPPPLPLRRKLKGRRRKSNIKLPAPSFLPPTPPNPDLKPVSIPPKKKRYSPADFKYITVRNPPENFDLIRTLSVKVKVERLNLPPSDPPIPFREEEDYSQLIHFGPIPPLPETEHEGKGTLVRGRKRKAPGTATDDSTNRRVSSRLLGKKVDEIVEPFALLSLGDSEEEQEDSSTLHEEQEEGTLHEKQEEGTLHEKQEEGTLHEEQEEGTLHEEQEEGTSERPPLIFTEDEKTMPALSLLSDPNTTCHIISTAHDIPFDYILISGPPGVTVDDPSVISHPINLTEKILEDCMLTIGDSQVRAVHLNNGEGEKILENHVTHSEAPSIVESLNEEEARVENNSTEATVENEETAKNKGINSESFDTPTNSETEPPGIFRVNFETMEVLPSGDMNVNKDSKGEGREVEDDVILSLDSIITKVIEGEREMMKSLEEGVNLEELRKDKINGIDTGG